MAADQINIPEGFEVEASAEVPEGFQLEDPSLVERAEDAANLGLAFMQGRTFGVGPKFGAALGAAIAKPVLEGAEAVSKAGSLMGLNDPYEAPSYGDLYKDTVNDYQAHIRSAYEKHPTLAPIAEVAGGLRTGIQGAKTKYGKGIDNWANAPQSTGSLAERAAALFGRAGRKALLGEAGYRTYKVGTSAPGEELDEAVSGPPVGGIVGGIASPVSDIAGSAVKAVTPQIDDALKPLVEKARKFNIPLSVDQVAPSKPLKNIQKISQELPLSGYGEFRDEQMKAFNKAIFKTFGEEADNFSQANMAKAFTNVGKQFDDFAKGRDFRAARFKNYIDEILVDEE